MEGDLGVVEGEFSMLLVFSEPLQFKSSQLQKDH